MDLTIIWAGIIAFAIVAYVVMDGFDLGIGILFPFFKVGRNRDTAMNSIAPVWDGNETWLVLGGGGLLAAFPLAYAIILPALYAPLMAMLLGLVLRGVAFEFRWRDPAHRALWDKAFTLGSCVATFAQGVTLGALLQGIHVEGRAYAGGWWDWLSPFSLLTGAGLMVGYALLGACWLNWKTEGELQDQSVRYAKRLGVALLGMIALVSLMTLTLEARYHERWLSFPGVLATAQVRSEARFNAVKAGLSQDDLQRVLGRPSNVRGLSFQQQNVWSYRYDSPFCQWFQVGVGYDGRVVDTAYGPDPLCDDDNFGGPFARRR